MAANSISTLSTKELKQVGKLNIAQAKRQGKTVARDGTISGSLDSTKPYYRTRNIYDITQLPTQYTGNAVTDNANASGLVIGRPWSAVATLPTSVSVLQLVGIEFYQALGTEYYPIGSGNTLKINNVN